MEYMSNQNAIMNLVLNNMKKLHEIAILENAEESFVLQLLQNSRETLKCVYLPQMSCIPDATFPNVTKLKLPIGEDGILLPEFQEFFPKVLKNMEFVEQIELYLPYSSHLPVCQYLREKYEKHFITANAYNVHHGELNDMPFKILHSVYNLNDIDQSHNYLRHIQYAHFNILIPRIPMDWGWDKYQEIFDQFTNLKAIELTHARKHFTTDVLPNLSETNQEIWKKIISYFEARGIRIANHGDIRNNENFRKQIEKEAGITWSFCFH